ncbi:DUF927 domain-containing protein [Xanthocytophaga agilis]|uniref:DUF927 domain-containing protein n=1 Tax=Xanthocytophaga agilis TaxID=3048010 RepID=A0AAE3UCU7_9BACT|nr:DUF927 domain-containing protein [Xanthocytophaga agilis]MDJ1500490.1 DUF927 domain-containing protein [Xanthocytophaga agilis]
MISRTKRTQPAQPEKEPANKEAKVISIGKPEDWDYAQKQHYDKAKKLVNQIKNLKLNIIESNGDLNTVASSLATFGEFGRGMFLQVAELMETFNEEAAHKIFESYLKENPAKTPVQFFKMCRDNDITTKAEKQRDPEAEIKDKLPNGVDMNDYMEFGFFEDPEKGSYWSVAPKGQLYEVSNFLMKILYHVQTSQDSAYRMIEVKNKFGYKTQIALNTDDFTSVGSFRKVIARRGNFIFKGSETDLYKLQDKLQREERFSIMIDFLGYHKRGQFYCFSNGLIDVSGQEEEVEFKEADDNGIIDHNDINYFIPAQSQMFGDKDEMFSNDKKFKYMESDIIFKDWVNQFVEVYKKRGKIGIAFYLSCLFRDVIYDAMDRRFPILFLYGQRGSGKGTMAQSILKLFGEGQDQFMLGGTGTTKGFMRKFAQFANAIVWLDEYKNNLNKQIIESLKNVYDGVGGERAKTDNSFQTHTTPIRSGCILSGQEMPTIEPALFTRVVLLTFKESSFTADQKKEFEKLKKMEAAGISHLTVDMLLYRQEVIEQFPENFKESYKILSQKVGKLKMDDRLLINYASLNAIASIFCKLDLLPFTKDNFLEVLISNIEIQHSVLQGSDDVSKFWEIVESLFNEGAIAEGKDFMLEDGYVYLRVQNIHGLYMKEMAMRRDPNVLAKSTLEDYLQLDPECFVKKLKKMFKDGSYSWCTQFVYNKININLIRMEDATERLRKYKEMGIDLPESEGVIDIDYKNFL